MLHLTLKCLIVVVIIHGRQTVGQSVCQYDLNYDICLTHLSQQSNPVCQNIHLMVGIEEVFDESLLMILTTVESAQENINDVSVKINLLNHTAQIETSRNISGYFLLATVSSLITSSHFPYLSCIYVRREKSICRRSVTDPTCCHIYGQQLISFTKKNLFHRSM